MLRVGQRVDGRQVAGNAARNTPVEDPTIDTVRLDEGGRQLPELPYIARLSGGHRQDATKVLRHTISAVLAELCLDQISQVRIDLNSRRRDAEELTGQCRRARSPEWIQACGNGAMALADCAGNNFGRERLFEVMPLLEGQWLGPSVATNGNNLALARPSLEGDVRIATSSHIACSQFHSGSLPNRVWIICVQYQANRRLSKLIKPMRRQPHPNALEQCIRPTADELPARMPRASSPPMTVGRLNQNSPRGEIAMEAPHERWKGITESVRFPPRDELNHAATSAALNHRDTVAAEPGGLGGLTDFPG